MKFCCELKNNILKGHKITKEEALRLYLEPLNELCNEANNIRVAMAGDRVDLCSIVNGKSGRCSENCIYCAQSIHFNTGIKEYPLLGYEDIWTVAKENEREGVDRFSIVTSGKALCGEEFNQVVSYYKKLGNECNISLCASHGILAEKQLSILKDVGVKRYHHNLETSRKFYNTICTTHSYQDRINTILSAKKVGLEVCSGGIIGLGESIEDRVDMAFELNELGIKSIPINALMAIKGTPLENQPQLSEEEILRTIAIFRFINPKAYIRLAAGRNLLGSYGEKAFNSGANATITGNLLTTCGNKICDDKSMIKSLGLKVKE